MRLAYFSRGVPSDLGANGNGAPPQARRHLNLRTPPSGSPHTKFDTFCNGCNRHLGPLFPSCGRLIGIPRPSVLGGERRMLGVTMCTVCVCGPGSTHTGGLVETKSYRGVAAGA